MLKVAPRKGAETLLIKLMNDLNMQDFNKPFGKFSKSE